MDILRSAAYLAFAHILVSTALAQVVTNSSGVADAKSEIEKIGISTPTPCPGFDFPQPNTFRIQGGQFGSGSIDYREFAPSISIFGFKFSSDDLNVKWSSLNTAPLAKACGNYVKADIGYGIRFAARQFKAGFGSATSDSDPALKDAKNFLYIESIGLNPSKSDNENSINKLFALIANGGGDVEHPLASLSLSNDQVLARVENIRRAYASISKEDIEGKDVLAPQIIAFYLSTNPLKGTRLELPLRFSCNKATGNSERSNCAGINQEAPNWTEVERSIANFEMKECKDGASRTDSLTCKVNIINHEINATLNAYANSYGSPGYSNASFLYRLDSISFGGDNVSAGSDANTTNPNTASFYIKYSRRPEYLRWNSEKDIYGFLRAGSNDIELNNLNASISSILIELNVKYHQANVKTEMHPGGLDAKGQDRVVLTTKDDQVKNITGFNFVDSAVKEFFQSTKSVNTIAESE